MPRSRSRSMLSSTWFSISRSESAPVSSSRRSASVDLPWSMCAMMEKLRMRDGSMVRLLLGKMFVDVGPRFFGCIDCLNEIVVSRAPGDVLAHEARVVIAGSEIFVHQSDLHQHAADELAITRHAGGLEKLVLVVVRH